MTAALSNTAQGTPFATGVDAFVYPQFISALRAPTTQDIYNPGTRWMFIDQVNSTRSIFETSGAGVWEVGGNPQATTTTAGITRYATLAEVMAGTGTNNATLAADVFALAQSIVVGAVPAATETNPGIAEIATQVETDAGSDDTRIVTPLKLANFIGSGGFPGVFTDLTATGTVSFTGATGPINMTSATASSFGVTGAGIDLTLSSAAGRVVVNGEEAAADAVRILSAAGGLDVDVALQMSLVTSQNAADAIVINASAGGIDITAAGAAGEDIDIVNTAGSINITAGESGVDSVVITSSIGGIQINAAGAAAGEDIAITATGSSIRLVSTENVVDSIVLSSTNGGIQILAPAAAPSEDIVLTATGSSIRLTATESATDSINIESTLGGVNILASGASAGEDINITATGSSVNLTSTEDAALAIYLHANGGTSETIRLRADQGTGVASIDILSDVGGVTIAGGLGTADAVNITATTAGGGIDIDSSTGGVDVLTTGGISIDASLTSNFTVTGAVQDLTISSVGGSVVITGTEAAVDAVQINGNTGAGGIDINAGTGGITVDSGGLMSLDAAGTVNLTTTGVFDITVNSTAGSVILTGAEAVADAIQLNATTALGGIDINAGSGGVTIDTTAAISLDSATASNFTVTGAADLTLNSTAGAVNVTSGGANADSILITSAGGAQLTATGAAAKDILITCTNGSMNITAGGAASRINLTAGTGSIKFASGWIVPVTTKATADTPYTVLGTDYLINCDTSAGVLTVTLPAATALAGRTFVIRDGVGSAAVNNITIGGGGTNLVDGSGASGTKTLSAAYSGATVYSNGTVWLYAYVA